MVRFRKSAIISTAILVGALTFGGTVYGVSQDKKHKQLITNAKQQINQEQDNLATLIERVNTFELSDGFIIAELTTKELEEVKNSLNSIKGSHSDFLIKKDDLKSDIKVLKLGKKNLELEISNIESKLALQTELNNLFESPVITGNTITDQAIRQDLNQEAIDAFKVTHEKHLAQSNKWVESVNSLLSKAEEQVAQLVSISEGVDALAGDDAVTLEAIAQAKTEVESLTNETLKSELKAKIEKAETVANANEQRVREEATAQQAQQAQQQVQSNSNSGVVNNNNNRTNQTTTPKSSAQQPSTSKPATKQPSTPAPTPQQPPASSGGGSNSGNTSGGNKTIDTSGAKKTGEGGIEYGGKVTGGTYEEWTVEGVDPSLFNN